MSKQTVPTIIRVTHLCGVLIRFNFKLTKKNLTRLSWFSYIMYKYSTGMFRPQALGRRRRCARGLRRENDLYCLCNGGGRGRVSSRSSPLQIWPSIILIRAAVGISYRSYSAGGEAETPDIFIEPRDHHAGTHGHKTYYNDGAQTFIMGAGRAARRTASPNPGSIWYYIKSYRPIGARYDIVGGRISASGSFSSLGGRLMIFCYDYIIRVLGVAPPIQDVSWQYVYVRLWNWLQVGTIELCTIEKSLVG